MEGLAQPADQRLVLDAFDAEIERARRQMAAVLPRAVLARAEAGEDLDAMTGVMTRHLIEDLAQSSIDAMLLTGVPAAQKTRQLLVGALAQTAFVVDGTPAQRFVQVDRVQIDRRIGDSRARRQRRFS